MIVIVQIVVTLIVQMLKTVAKLGAPSGASFYGGKNQMDELYQPLYGYIRKRVSSSQDAEDITQDVFLKAAIKNLSEVNQIKAWLFKVAKNTLMDYYRKNFMHLSNEEIQENLYPEGEGNSLLELAGCVRAFIKKLPEKDQVLLNKIEFENVSQKELAEELGLNYTSLKSMVQRGRQKLKPHLESCCKDEDPPCEGDPCGCA